MTKISAFVLLDHSEVLKNKFFLSKYNFFCFKSTSVAVSETIFSSKNMYHSFINSKHITHNLISKFNYLNLELSIHEPCLIKLVPSLSVVYDFI
jgi:hypothetical protein